MRNRCVSRRGFIAGTVAVTTAAVAAGQAKTAGAQPSRPPLCVFSKHIQFLNYKDMAAFCKRAGLDGVDLTVRKGGHVLPENAATDLPAAVDAVRAEGLEVCMITTNLKSGADPDARPILEAASKRGIRYFRIGGHKYAELGNPFDELPAITADLKGLAALADEYNMAGGYHNHSGPNYFGAPLWDLREVLAGIGNDHIGSNFDIGHATVEGGYGVWQINARLMAPHVKMMAVKDFRWGESERPQWCPLGEGRVRIAEFLRIFREAGFAGPISMHFEYDMPSNDAMLEAIEQAAVTLRAQLKEAGYV